MSYGLEVAPRETYGVLLTSPSILTSQYRSLYLFHLLYLHKWSCANIKECAIESIWISVHYRVGCGRGSRNHWDRWHSGEQHPRWFLSTWKRVHFPRFPLRTSAPGVKLHLEPSEGSRPTSRVIRPYRRSHSGDRGRFANNIWIMFLFFFLKKLHLLTQNSDVGYYLSAQLWNHSLGSTAVVRTAVLPPTPPDGECLMFWYYMEGSGAGELTVYLESLDEQLWKRSGDQGRHWRHGRVTLLSPGSVYQVDTSSCHVFTQEMLWFEK